MFGAESGATSACDILSEDLQAIIDAWGVLPQALRDGIVAMVKQAIR
jgi:hypothetical protein